MSWKGALLLGVIFVVLGLGRRVEGDCKESTDLILNAKLVGRGETCSLSSTLYKICTPPLTCSDYFSNSGTCIDDPFNGACTTKSDCSTSNVENSDDDEPLCLSNVCRFPGTAGEQCTTALQCLSGTCTNNKCIGIAQDLDCLASTSSTNVNPCAKGLHCKREGTTNTAFCKANPTTSGSPCEVIGTSGSRSDEYFIAAANTVCGYGQRCYVSSASPTFFTANSKTYFQYTGQCYSPWKAVGEGCVPTAAQHEREQCFSGICSSSTSKCASASGASCDIAQSGQCDNGNAGDCDCDGSTATNNNGKCINDHTPGGCTSEINDLFSCYQENQCYIHAADSPSVGASANYPTCGNEKCQKQIDEFNCCDRDTTLPLVARDFLKKVKCDGMNVRVSLATLFLVVVAALAALF